MELASCPVNEIQSNHKDMERTLEAKSPPRAHAELGQCLFVEKSNEWDWHWEDCGERERASSLDVKRPGKKRRKLRPGTQNPAGQAGKKPWKIDLLTQTAFVLLYCSSSVAWAFCCPCFPLPPPFALAFLLGLTGAAAAAAAALLEAAAGSIEDLLPVISLRRVEIQIL